MKRRRAGSAFALFFFYAIDTRRWFGTMPDIGQRKIPSPMHQAIKIVISVSYFFPWPGNSFAWDNSGCAAVNH
jgi:hypothetical protein